MTSASAAINDEAVPSSLSGRQVQRLFGFGTIEPLAARVFFVMECCASSCVGTDPIGGPSGPNHEDDVRSLASSSLGGNVKVSTSDQLFFRG